MYTFIYFTSLVFKLCQQQFSQKATIEAVVEEVLKCHFDENELWMVLKSL